MMYMDDDTISIQIMTLFCLSGMLILHKYCM